MPDHKRNRPAGNGPAPSDHLADDHPEDTAGTAALDRIRRALALAVWTHNGRRALTRTYHSTSSAQRAVERAEARGDMVAVVLVRLTPVHTGWDPLQIVIDDDTVTGGAA